MTFARSRVLFRAAFAGVVLALCAMPVVHAQDDDEEQEPQREVRVYDVGDLTQPAWASLAGSQPHSPQLLGWHRWYVEYEEEEPVGADTIAESVAELTGTVVAEVDEEAGWQSMANGEFVVDTTAEGHERARAAIELLRRATPGEIVLEVADVTIPADAIDDEVVALLQRASSGRLDDASFASLRMRDAGRGVGGGTITVTSGQMGRMEHVRRTSCVFDIDVEIAEGAEIADPIVLSVEDGLRVHALPFVLVDGRVLVRTFATLGAVDRPFRRVNLGRAEIGTVELPTLRAGFSASSAVMSVGDSSTAVMWRPNGGARVLRFTLVSAEGGEHGGTLDVFPMGALTSMRGLHRSSWGDDPDGEPPLGLWMLTLDEYQNPISNADSIRELLWRSEPSPFENDEAYLESHDWLVGGAMIARGTSALVDRLRAQIAAMERRTVNSVNLSVRLEERRAGAATRTISIVSGSIPVGQTAAMGAYREDAYAADLDVEVAQNAEISDPIIRRTLHGVVGNALVRRARDGFVAEIEMRVCASSEPGEQIAHGVENVGVVERAVTDVRYLHSRVEMGTGNAREIALGASPYSKDVAQLVAVIEITE